MPAGESVTRPADFYQALWQGEPDAENASRWSFQEELVARALDWCGPLESRVVLEIGPGLGRESVALANRGAHVVAVDLVPASLQQTRRAAAGKAVTLAQARAEALPLKSDSVDVVFVQTVLMHLDLEAVAREWARALRRDGRVVILEPLAGNPLVAIYRRWLSPYRATDPRYITVRGLVAAAPGFAIARHEEHFLFAIVALAAPLRFRRSLRRWLGVVDRALFRVPPLRRLAWMTLIELRRR